MAISPSDLWTMAHSLSYSLTHSHPLALSYTGNLLSRPISGFLSYIRKWLSICLVRALPFLSSILSLSHTRCLSLRTPSLASNFSFFLSRFVNGHLSLSFVNGPLFSDSLTHSYTLALSHWVNSPSHPNSVFCFPHSKWPFTPPK